MSDKLLPLSHCLIEQRPSDTPLAYHAGQLYSSGQFINAVEYWAGKLQAQPYSHYALYTEDAYPFAVLLFALLHAGKQIWIPGNNRPGTAGQLEQDCQLLGDWQDGESFDYCLDASADAGRPLSPLNPLARQLVIFTSGSTGQAKPIVKCLNQFQLEIVTLEKYWGEQLGDAEALATVSHQHIYGLLFRVLWPLSAGRCFHSQAYINPETLVNAVRHGPAYWIASPAHLKRLDRQSPWDGIRGLKAIFSSGGALPESAAQQIAADSGQSVIEVYGSSETGGIAWRRQNRVWTLFEGMKLSFVDDKCLLHSPYLQSGDLQLDDQITLLDDGRFMLNGRSDRIVKIEEKRLSLAELEQRLVNEACIDDAHALVFNRNRDVVAVAIVLSPQGKEQLQSQGRHKFIQQLRKALASWFEAVVLPRKWLFVNAIPLTQQGKVQQLLLKTLLDIDSKKLPQALNLEMSGDNIRLDIKVPEDLLYFPDHFMDYPILPGVVQLAWVEHFGKLFFAIDKPFSHLEVVKFTQLIRPGDDLTLVLDWKADSGKLYFNFSTERESHSSGRIVYGGNA
ncbi:AMP-binding protein [Candidatus Methylobacter oryzae]|uniref:AMP-binding protein n=1 Tax=Candidatus Methylobacter oryzae TaxID=2497749 RepID=A0ABY3C572_9GAMM|nr:AMP-binding protein [Candidatus Methylobacter oryzae]TRW89647.1 AMP-binding protein [Candidatus Methylobacter oryzae]